MSVSAKSDQEGFLRMVGAIDIGGTKIAVGLVDPMGRVVVKQEISTGAEKSFDEAIDGTIQALSALLSSTGHQLDGIGIGCTGPVDPLTGVLGDVNTLPLWTGRNLVEHLSRHFGVSAAVENDADAVALGEALCGAGKGKESVVCITVGTGIGGGVMLNGQVYRGVKGNHPELGHQIIDPTGPQCTCGQRGCWESLASGPAMALWMQENTTPRDESKVLTAKEICDLAQAGDGLAMRAVQREARYLAIGVANVIACFLPEIVLLGGSVMKSAQLFLPEIRAMSGGCQIVPSRLCEIALVSLGDDAGLTGAAQVWHQRFQNSRSLL
jgi:glucokinase